MGDPELYAKQPLVIDNGSGYIKAGLGAEESPKLIFNSYIGRPKHKKIMSSAGETEIFVGNKAESNRGLLKLTYPIEHGIVQDWNGMEEIWKYIFSEVNVSPQELTVMLTEAPLNPYSNRERAAEIMFETFSVPAMFMCSQAVLSLYASGKMTGVVLDCGDGVCHACPIFDGFTLNNTLSRIDIGGRDVTEHLMLLLRRAGYLFHTSAEFEIVRRIKEQACSLLTSSGGDEKKADLEQKKKINYLLPDGSEIRLAEEKFRAPEVLFSPDIIGMEYPGVHDMLLSSINKADLDLKKYLFESIYLAGGTTLMNGFAERLFSEIRDKKADNVKIRIFSPKDRNITCWLGGSILSALAVFKKMWITKKEYDEEGVGIVHLKTF